MAEDAMYDVSFRRAPHRVHGASRTSCERPWRGFLALLDSADLPGADSTAARAGRAEWSTPAPESTNLFLWSSRGAGGRGLDGTNALPVLQQVAADLGMARPARHRGGGPGRQQTSTCRFAPDAAHGRREPRRERDRYAGTGRASRSLSRARRHGCPDGRRRRAGVAETRCAPLRALLPGRRGAHDARHRPRAAIVKHIVVAAAGSRGRRRHRAGPQHPLFVPSLLRNAKGARRDALRSMLRSGRSRCGSSSASSRGDENRLLRGERREDELGRVTCVV